jgi:(E)-4-hydroxy-3-methyl-but-2-enyl pyrophosphate reductase
MRITLSQFAGFCDGVKRAYEMVMDLDISRAKKPVFVLGALVHNPEVIKKIEEKGIRKIGRTDFFSENFGDIGTLIITAHGDSPDIFRLAEEKKIDIFDVTCPKVVKVQRLAKLFFEKGYRIVIFGDRGHKEIIGIQGWSGGEAIIVSDKEEAGRIDLDPYPKIAVLSQTTQNVSLFHEIARAIVERNEGKEIEIIDTTCDSARERQEEVRKMAGDNDRVLVIGSKTSANSTRLFEIAQGINPNSYFVDNADEIDKDWFRGAESIGVAAGASTPFWVLREAISVLEKI